MNDSPRSALLARSAGPSREATAEARAPTKRFSRSSSPGPTLASPSGVGTGSRCPPDVAVVLCLEMRDLRMGRGGRAGSRSTGTPSTHVSPAGAEAVATPTTSTRPPMARRATRAARSTRASWSTPLRTKRRLRTSESVCTAFDVLASEMRPGIPIRAPSVAVRHRCGASGAQPAGPYRSRQRLSTRSAGMWVWSSRPHGSQRRPRPCAARPD